MILSSGTLTVFLPKTNSLFSIYPSLSGQRGTKPSFTPNTAINGASDISASFLRLEESQEKGSNAQQTELVQKKKDFLLLYTALPESLRIFTDGSYYGNTGGAASISWAQEALYPQSEFLGRYSYYQCSRTQSNSQCM
jgi:hypothetical protein